LIIYRQNERWLRRSVQRAQEDIGFKIKNPVGITDGGLLIYISGFLSRTKFVYIIERDFFLEVCKEKAFLTKQIFAEELLRDVFVFEFSRGRLIKWQLREST
jgi:hypothetical protein